MKINFQLSTGKIYDFLVMPDLVFGMDKAEENNYDELVDEEYELLLEELKKKLKPYKERIDFYYMENYAYYKFLNCLQEIHNYKSVEAYLDFMLSLNEGEIRRRIAIALLISNKGENEYLDIKQKAEEICKDKLELIGLVKESSFEASEKWNLFCIVEEPVRYMKEYVTLMNDLKPVFDEVYEGLQAGVKEYAETFKENIDKQGIKFLNDISDNYFKDSLFEEVDVNVTLSLLASYSIILNMNDTESNIFWGIKVEEAFKEIKKKYKDKLDKRVIMFKNLGDKTRYEILRLIAENEEYCSKDIADKLNITGATVSYHISNLTTANIIQLDKKNKKNIYSINKEYLNECIEEFKKDLNIY